MAKKVNLTIDGLGKREAVENTIFGIDHKYRMTEDGACFCTPTNLKCLLEDAEYYSDPSDWEEDKLRLVKSAQRIVKRLKDAR